MQSGTEYLERTASAVKKLFEGVESYTAGLERAVPPVFVSSGSDRAQADAEFETWRRRHDAEIKAAFQAQRDYFAETIALATLCGSVLQVAAKALEQYSTAVAVPGDWAQVIKGKHARYCVGRQVYGVPIGLVILAGRNQHMHFGEEPLREPNVTIFERLATFHTRASDPAYRDPAFDLDNKALVSFAHNITALLGWRSFDAYGRDLRALVTA